MMMASDYLIHSVYAPQVQRFRLALSQNQVWRFLDTPDSRTLELFLIEYCALGVAMTEPVERWFRQAGERCHELGHAEVGAFLISQANRQKEHHVPFVRDTHWLVQRWNRKHDRQLDAESLMAQPLPAGVVSYHALHEAISSGNAPYCLIAIAFEIDRLSLTYGVAAIPKIARVLGRSAIKGLQFLQGRVQQGTWHTSRHEQQLNRVLQDVPSALAVLTETAGTALQAYSDYLSNCLALAFKEAGRSQGGAHSEVPSIPLKAGNDDYQEETVGNG